MKARMTACEEVQLRASAYLDGRLDSAVRREVQKHLKRCPACLHEYRALRKISHAAAALPQIEAPRGLARRVRHTVSHRRQKTLARLGCASVERSRKPGVPYSRMVWGAVAALFIGLVFLAGYLLGRREERLGMEPQLALLEQQRDEAFGEIHRLRTGPAGREESDGLGGRTRGDALAQTPGDGFGPTVPEGVGKLRRAPAVDAHDYELSSDMSWQPYRERGFRPLEFLRSARALQSDVAILDRLDRSLQLPLLRAQIEYFDLDQQVGLWRELSASGRIAPPADLAPIVDFVDSVIEDVESADEHRGLLDLFQRAKNAQPFARLSRFAIPQRATTGQPEVSSGRNRPAIDQLVNRLAPELPDASKTELIDTLRMKQRWIEDRFEDLPEAVQAQLSLQRKAGGSLALSRTMTLAGCALDHRRDEFFDALMSSMSTERPGRFSYSYTSFREEEFEGGTIVTIEHRSYSCGTSVETREKRSTQEQERDI